MKWVSVSRASSPWSMLLDGAVVSAILPGDFPQLMCLAASVHTPGAGISLRAQAPFAESDCFYSPRPPA